MKEDLEQKFKRELKESKDDKIKQFLIHEVKKNK